mmetsp:Transcript_13308/g.53697  ORF Transcript_13308/g.53697 Transcript_13308/m.53697 type:complete len:225 (-) Transcript_13308:263-937(-)
MSNGAHPSSYMNATTSTRAPSGSANQPSVSVVFTDEPEDPRVTLTANLNALPTKPVASYKTPPPTSLDESICAYVLPTRPAGWSNFGVVPLTTPADAARCEWTYTAGSPGFDGPSLSCDCPGIRPRARRVPMSTNASCAERSFASSGPVAPLHRATASIRVATECAHRAAANPKPWVDKTFDPACVVPVVAPPESDSASIQRSLPATSASSTALIAASLTSPTA